MRFNVSSGRLLQALQTISGAVPSNPVIPILEFFLFELKPGLVEISASDNTVSIKSIIEANVEGNGRVAIPARLLLDTLKSFPEQPLTFQIDPETHAVAITSSHGKYKLVGADAGSFPMLADFPDAKIVQLDGKVLQDAINTTIFAATNDEMRLNLSGIFFNISAADVKLAATDAHKLVQYTISGIQANKLVSFTLPKKGANLLKNALADNPVHLAANDKMAFFSFGNIEMSCLLIDKKFPDYENVIPRNNDNILTIPRNDLLNSLKRIAIFANKTTNQVNFAISDGSLTISAQDLDFSNEATEQLVCEYDGEPMTIAFNARFLIEMLQVLHSEHIRMELSTPDRAGLLFPAQTPDNVDILMLLMPVVTRG